MAFQYLGLGLPEADIETVVLFGRIHLTQWGSEIINEKYLIKGGFKSAILIVLCDPLDEYSSYWFVPSKK